MNPFALNRILVCSLLGAIFLTTPSVLACANHDGRAIGQLAKFNPNRIPKFIFEANVETEAIQQIAHLVASSKRDWAKLSEQLADANQSFASGPSLDNARAVVMMRLGQPEQAVEFLKATEESYPNRYHTAANLGTAFELSGNLTKAKEWISEGIDRNPDSHSGTEWLHVKILDARIALSKNPNWLRKHSVTGLDFGQNPAPNFSPNIQKERHLKALKYQLRERISFVSPPDAIVGDLLFDLANLKSQDSTPLSTLAHLRLAQLYSPDTNRPLAARLRYFEKKRVEWDEREKKELEKALAEEAKAKEAEFKARTAIADAREAKARAVIAARSKMVTERLPIRHVAIELLLEDLMRLVPEAEYKLSLRRRVIKARGTSDQLSQVKRLIEILDQPDRY